MTRVERLSFLRKHRLAVQSTVSPSGSPEAAVAGVAFTDQLEITFDPLDSSRKCVNLRHSAKAAGCRTYKWSLSRPAFLPVVFKFAIQMAAAEGQDGVGPSNGPEHF